MATGSREQGISLPAGWEEVKTTTKRRLVIAVDGWQKSGKTHFALTAPRPAAMFSIDDGLEGMVAKHIDPDRRLFVKRYRVNVRGHQGEHLPQWESLIRDYIALLHNPGIKTIIWDTAGEVYQLQRMARFGKIDKVMPQHYGPVLAEYGDLVREVYDTDKNLILLHHLKPLYKDDKRSSECERDGMSRTGGLVQVNLTAYRDGIAGPFHLRVDDCRQNPDVAGLDLEGEMCDFATLASLIYPETAPDDWR